MSKRINQCFNLAMEFLYYLLLTVLFISILSFPFMAIKYWDSPSPDTIVVVDGVKYKIGKDESGKLILKDVGKQ